MLMEQSEFKTLLEESGVQVFYNHTTTEDVVAYPFIVFLDDRTDSLYADNITYYESAPYTVILHTLERDYALEQTIKTLLTNNGIAYSLNDIVWNREYLFWQVSFNVEIMK